MTEIMKVFANRTNIMRIGHTCCSDKVNDGLQIAAEKVAEESHCDQDS